MAYPQVLPLGNLFLHETRLNFNRLQICSTGAGLLSFYRDPAIDMPGGKAFAVVPRLMPDLGLQSANGVCDTRLFRVFARGETVMIDGDSMAGPEKLVKFGRSPFDKEDLLKAIKKAQKLTEEAQAAAAD